jgi:hypothetical protein
VPGAATGRESIVAGRPPPGARGVAVWLREPRGDGPIFGGERRLHWTRLAERRRRRREAFRPKQPETKRAPEVEHLGRGRFSFWLKRPEVSGVSKIRARINRGEVDCGRRGGPGRSSIFGDCGRRTRCTTALNPGDSLGDSAPAFPGGKRYRPSGRSCALPAIEARGAARRTDRTLIPRSERHLAAENQLANVAEQNRRAARLAVQPRLAQARQAPLAALGQTHDRPRQMSLFQFAFERGFTRLVGACLQAMAPS